MQGLENSRLYFMVGMIDQLGLKVQYERQMALFFKKSGMASAARKI